MRQILSISMILSCFVLLGWAAEPQVEFTGKVVSLQQEGDGNATLTVGLTPAVAIPVRVTGKTPVWDDNGHRSSAADLSSGQTVKVKGLFTDDGILGLEIEMTEDENEFELRGPIQAHSPGSGLLVVRGVDISVSQSTVIRDEDNSLLSLGELVAGQFVEVEGAVVNGKFAARQIRLEGQDDGFAEIEIEGEVEDIRGRDMIVEIKGRQRALVEIEQETEIRGNLAVGARVAVSGELTERLAIRAATIAVEQQFELMPDEIKLSPAASRSVDVVLRVPLAEDATVELASLNPAIARAVTPTIQVPAGSVIASFEVRAGSGEGETHILATLQTSTQSFSHSLKVEVESDGPDDAPGDELLEVKWSPDRITSGPAGPRDVRLQLNQPAPADLRIVLFHKDGIAGLVSFPTEVTINQGEWSVAFQVTIHATQGAARVRAQLESAWGGDTDDLEVEFESETEQLELHWSPDELRVGPGTEGTVLLVLDRPAPEAIDVLISLKDGVGDVLQSFPSQVSFAGGMRQVEIRFRAEKTGKVRYRAALPFHWGGDSDDLEVEVRN